MTEGNPEKLEYVVSPLKENFGIIFPEGTTEPEKKLLAIRLEEARLRGKDIELDPSLKIVPLRSKTEVNTVIPTPVLTPQSTPTPIPTTQTIVTPIPTPTTIQRTETVIVANPVNPTQPSTIQEKVQEQKQN